MIRWRFVIKRLLLVVAILALLRWSLGPLVQFASVWTLEKSVGARVDIAQTRVGFFPPRLQYVDVQIGDAREGKQNVNAFAADSIDLSLDGNALLHRRFVASDGRISGIRIGGQRATSGHLEQPPEPESPSDGPSLIGQLLGGLGDDAVEGLQSVGNSLETVKRSDEIRRRWKQQYADLEDRAKALEAEVRMIRDEAKGIDNPLRDLPRLQATIARAEAVRQELISIRQTLDALPAQVQADWVALDEAKRIDVQRVREFIPASVEQPERLGPELLKQIVQAQIQGVRDYMDSARELADWTVASPQGAERPRGDDIRLVKTDPLPSVLVQRCQLDGLMSVNGDSYTIAGILENLTPQTERLDDPFRARLRLEGPRTVRVDFKRHYDDQGGKPRDVLIAHWPDLQLDRTQLGKPSEAQLQIDGGNLDLYVQIEAVGTQMRGQLVSRQTDTQVRLQTADKYAQLAAIESLQNSLAAIEHVEVQANFAGTWSDLDLSLATNLTDALSHGLSNAMAAQVAASRQQLESKIEAEHREQMRTLQTWLGEQHAEARDVLAQADSQIDTLKAKLASELPAASTYLGKLGSTLRDLR
ncbi:TIGR03545 family protein [Roseimaritima ulvae]|uniref:TIGR03545 family protein n=1 Tax=Roseimaritima ulvae TaxID=980254 RepID=A0A5B9R1L1_9BACT|nr:TIGR03545 family protein [Roseimaritima ulvae]QEG40213.1 hypothetical protein UC8_22200 [Roseimaritima ulvae]